ncbi:G protein-coupled receptor 126 [Mytilus galloprovincialis]|uniref:G protein-coupled receptor 126 n=1 Tax=Mytilus galloprovincialis TaxID=29158 RepID=A0A8B6GJE7_MYTGA|nr:G protein-coupled receptor 126 [Mytilus galloprovincialis]
MESADNKLECPLNNEHPELPVMWYKDGIPLTPKLTKESKSITFPSLSNIDATLTSDLYLTTDLSRSLDFSDANDTIEILQGRYWCEVWTSNPFKRLESKPTLIRYSDVMSFVGFLNIHPLTVYERTVYNMMNEKSLSILNVVKDLQTIYDSILSDIQLIVPEVVIIKVNPDFVESGKPQRLKFYTHVTMSTTYTMATERSINLLLRRELRENLQNTSFMLSLPGRTPIHLVRSLKFYSTVACPMDQLKDKETSLVATFPSSATGLEVTSIETCEGEVAGRAKCDGDFETGAHWTDVRVFKTCNNNGDDDSENTDSSSEEQDDATVMGHISRERRLKELAEVDVEDNNAETVMEETAEIIENAQEITAEYIDYIAEIVDKTSEVSQATQMTSENIVKTVDRLLDIDDDEVKKSTKANSIINSLEKVAGKMDLDVYGQFRIVTPNVALEVWDLKYQSLPIIGLAAREDQKTKEFDESNIITLYNRSQVYFENINAAIELPPELVEEVMTEQESRLYMMVYRHGRLFQTMTEAQVNLEQNREAQFVDDSGTLNSFVISASIGGKKIENLKNHVKAIFKPLKDVKGKEKTCAHWDFTLNNNRGGWSAKGCVYNGTVNGRDICLCNHLTNFAVLIDFYGQAEPIPEHHEISLSIISLIGLSLSILGLSLTIISYAFFRKLRRGRAQQTLFNLALSMLCSWVVFLTGIRQTHSFYGCIVVAVLLHYFILSSFMWMLMEAFLQYLTFVKVLGTYVTRYRLKTVLVAWGLPLVPVVAVLSIDYTLYSGGSRYCWMSLTAFYYSFAIPVGLIILCNLTVFVVTVISICRRPTGLRTNQSKSKMAMANLQAAITSFVLLGLTWFLGYLAISDARLPFQYAFTILNSLQGFFIFILFVLRKKRVRDQWLILCCCKVPEQEKALRSLSASGSIPSTGSGRSSYSGRSERSDSTRTTTSFVNDSYDSLFFPFKSSRPTLYYREKSNSITSE